MKKKLALMLAMVMSLGMAVPAMAAQNYSYKAHTLTDVNGNIFKFDKAETQYALNHAVYTEKGYIKISDPVLILKDGSGFSWKWSHKLDYIEHMTTTLLSWEEWHFSDDVVAKDAMGLPFVGGYNVDAGISEDARKVEDALYHPKAESADIVAVVRDQNNEDVVLMKESTAKKYDDCLVTKSEKVVTMLTKDMLTLSNEHLVGTGVSYTCTVTNTTDDYLKGSYVVVFYTPELSEYGEAFAQVNILELNLAPGQSWKGELISNFKKLVENYEIMTGRFEDDADKRAFLKNAPLTEVGGRYVADADKCAEWLESLEVTF